MQLKQSVSHWCFNPMTVSELASLCKSIGIQGIDLVGPEHFSVLREFDLTPTLLPSHPIDKGLNRIENHPQCLTQIRSAIEAAAEIGAPNVVCFSGNRDGLDDEIGLGHCAAAIRQVVGLAESKGVTLCMELLNSKKDHADYMADYTAWGARLVKSIGSPRFKLLYDIYHLQVQEGNIIATIGKYADCIGHYHTGGVPGRHEIDQSQELNYPAIVQAIIATGYQGWIAHEFIPAGAPETALRNAYAICGKAS